MNITPRQAQIICYRCDEGLSRRETAERMYITEDAVKEHTRRLLRRLPDCRSFYQVCMRHGRRTMLEDLVGRHTHSLADDLR